MKHKLLSVFAATALVVTGASSAVAGEVTGSGEDLVVNGRSICAFSGLNDEVSEEEPDRTQSFGTIVKGAAKAGLVSTFATTGIGGASATNGVGIPGHACNPNIGFPE
jgi:hypothetical protein